MDYKIIDCDQHVIEPPDLWKEYLPERFHDQAPKLVKDEDGGDAWQLGPHTESLGLVAAMHQTPETLKSTIFVLCLAFPSVLHVSCIRRGPRSRFPYRRGETDAGEGVLNPGGQS